MADSHVAAGRSRSPLSSLTAKRGSANGHVFLRADALHAQVLVEQPPEHFHCSHHPPLSSQFHAEEFCLMSLWPGKR